MSDPQDNIRTFICPYDNGAGEQAALDLIHSAKKSINIICYGFTDSKISGALIAQKTVGIPVIVLMDSTEAATPTQKLIVADLQDAGITVLTGKSPVRNELIHLKTIIVDEEIILSGSWNFSPSASNQINVIDIISSPERAKMFMDAFNRLYKYLLSRPKKKSFMQRVREWVSR